MSLEERQQGGIAILRIKRKRTHQPQPLDALGIFRFAETVPIDSFSTPSKTRSLRDRIRSFLAHPPPSLSRHASSSSLRSSTVRTGPPTPQSAHAASAPDSPQLQASPARRKLPSALRALRAAAASSAGDPADVTARDGQSRASTVHELAKVHRYRIIEKRRTQVGLEGEVGESQAKEQERLQEDEEIRRGLRPPRVVSADEIRQKRKAEPENDSIGAGMRIYDAVEEGEDRSGVVRLPSPVLKVVQTEDDDLAMDQFGDMLKEYLTLQESITPSDAHSAPTTTSLDSHVPKLHSSPAILPTAAAPLQPNPPFSTDNSDDDFVYDVYYRDTSTALAAAATTVALNGEGGWDVGSLSGLRRIGQLAGMQDLFEDDNAALLVHENDVDPSSEEEDLADQDSNEENDYRNDYPSDEDPASDNFISPAATVPLGWREKRVGADWDSEDSEDESGEETGWSD